MTSPFTTICFFIVYETIRFHIAVCLFRKRCHMMSNCGHQWHLAAPCLPPFCSYHVDFDGICERNHISITNSCSFWPIPRVLVSQTERNRQRQDSSGVVKKRVRSGSSRYRRRWLHNMTHTSLVFSFLCYSIATQYGIAFYQLNARNSLCLFSHTHMLLFHCLQFVPRKQFLSQAAAK